MKHLRFISHSRRFQVLILSPVKEYVNGQEREIAPMLVARFKQGDLTAEELEFAERKWDKVAHGRTLEMDQVTKTPLLGRLSMYDTGSPAAQAEFEAIDRALQGQEHVKLPRGQRWKDGDAERITIERLLSTSERTRGADFALFEEQPVPAPWPTYDSFPGNEEDLLEVLIEQGHHLPQVLAYERQQDVHPRLIPMLEEEIDRNAPVGAEVIPA